MSRSTSNTSEDPLSWIARVASRLRTCWMLWTYPFNSVGEGFWAHYSCDLSRPASPYIKLGNSVALDCDVWLNIPEIPEGGEPLLLIEDGCKIGRRCMVSAKNRVHIGRDTILSPQVLVMDHNHAFEEANVPISRQGITEGGTIRIEEGCWIGFGAVIVCSKGDLVIGPNSVVGANSVVTRSVPPYSVVAGNPAKLVKRFDPSKGE